MKTTLLTFGLLIATALTFGQTKSASYYFMFKKGVKYYYKALGVDGTGKIPEMSYHCFGLENENGEMKGMYHFNSPYGWQGLEIYVSSGNSVQMKYTKNAYSGGDVNPPKPILKLPTSNSPIKWTWGPETFYEAKYVESVKTATKTYTDCIVVSESTKPEYKMGTKKKYYAKGLGLVKIEFYDANDKLIEMMSFELVKYE